MRYLVYLITARIRPNKVTSSPGHGSIEAGISEAEEAFAMVKDAITSLMKTSIIIRQTTPRDRYVKAGVSEKSPFIDTFDIPHVGHKFPKIDVEGRQWLKERLGKVITQRRQYLKYAQEHHLRFQHPEKDEGSFEIKAQPDILGSTPKISSLAATVKSLPSSAFAPTDASTLQTSKLRPMGSTVKDELEDLSDTYSQTSFATSVNDIDGESKLRPPKLIDITNTSPFECPYCWTLQEIKDERKWR